LTLRKRLDPLEQRLKAKGYHLGLHLERFPRYSVYYGYYYLFSEGDPDKLIQKATEYVDSIGKPELPD
jgi:hypothetical protein